MPIEIKELIIQALVGSGKNSGTNTKPAERKKQAQEDMTQLISKMIKNEKER